jgi:hypothetical protein
LLEKLARKAEACCALLDLGSPHPRTEYLLVELDLSYWGLCFGALRDLALALEDSVLHI